MDENLMLSELAKKLKSSKEMEIKQIEQIEKENLSELTKRLSEHLTQELATIEKDIKKSRVSILKREKEIGQEIESLSKKTAKIQAKQWIKPALIGLSIMTGLAIGAWGLGAYTSHLIQKLKGIKKDIAEEQANKEIISSYLTVVKTYNDGIELSEEPKIWKSDNGNWIIMFKNKENE